MIRAARELFEACLELPPDAREARLAACPEAAVREEVRRLLAAHEVAEASGRDPLAPTRPPQPPLERVGPYRILERLGEGAMGEVWLAAQDTPVQRQVALKILKAGMDTREVIARFALERQTLALMSHANVARMLDAGATEGGRPYFAMEYVAGLPLTRYCDDRWLDVPARLRLFLEVCAGVQHAHHRGIIHRDLKPSNVLVAEIDGRPVPKIIDFGIAKAISMAGGGSGTPHTRLGHLLGTPGYMSPEQAELSPLDVDTRTDVYSLGALLYELLTGTLPLTVDPSTVTPAALARELLTRDVERPSRRVRADAPEAATRAERRGTTPRGLANALAQDLDWIVLKALARDRRHRYDSVAELCRDVERHLQHEPVAAGPPSAGYRLRKFVRRHRVLVGSTAALMVASIAFGSLMALQARETARERDRAAVEAATARQVSQLLVELFASSDPGSARGRAVPARELLDAAAVRLERETALAPPVRARLQNAIGEVYLNLGLDEEALRQFEGARTALAGRVPAHDRDLLVARRGVGRAHVNRTRYAAADPLLSDALALAETHYGRADRLYGDLANDMGTLRFYQGRNEESRAHLEAAYAVRRAAYGENSLHTLVTLTNLGTIRSRLGDDAGAEATLREAYARLRQHFGEDHPQLIRAGVNLAANLSRAGRGSEALELYERLVPHATRVLGPMHASTLTILGNYASALRNAGRNAQALAIHRDVQARVLETLGPESREALVWNTHLGVSLGLAGRVAEGERRLREAIATGESRFGPAHFDTLNARLGLGDVLARAGRHAEAAAAVAPIVDRAEGAVPPPMRRGALMRLADAAYARGLEAEGERWRAALAGRPLRGDVLRDYPALAARLRVDRSGQPDERVAGRGSAGMP